MESISPDTIWSKTQQDQNDVITFDSATSEFNNTASINFELIKSDAEEEMQDASSSSRRRSQKISFSENDTIIPISPRKSRSSKSNRRSTRSQTGIASRTRSSSTRSRSGASSKSKSPASSRSRSKSAQKRSVSRRGRRS